MIYNMDTLDRVIDKIVRDLGLGQDQVPYEDIIEWAADALLHIGAYTQFIEKSCIVKIENYEGLLPCDLHKVIRLKKGCEVTSSGDSGFYGGTLVSMLNKAGVDYESLGAYERFHEIAVPGISKIDNNLGVDEIADKLVYNGNLIGNPNVTKFTSNDYNINLNKITTGFCHGIIELQYLAFPVDERGWPLVPDDVSFRDALFWKCAYHMSMRDPSTLKNPRMQDMEYCRQQWNRTCMQARAGAMMPDLAQIERLKNNWLRMIPDFNPENTDYRTVGRQQGNNLDGRY